MEEGEDAVVEMDAFNSLGPKNKTHISTAERYDDMMSTCRRSSSI